MDAAITQSLLSRALPIMGRAGDARPLDSLSTLLRFEPALAPQLAEYVVAYGANGPEQRTNARSAFDELVDEDILSTWQRIWIAEAAGSLRSSRTRSRPHIDWLIHCVEEGASGLAATAAAALGRLKIDHPTLLASAIDRVAPQWRQLVLWGLARLDPDAADSAADNQLDRLLLRTLRARS